MESEEDEPRKLIAETKIIDDEGNVLYYSRQNWKKGNAITFNLGKLLQMKKRNERVKLRKPRT